MQILTDIREKVEDGGELLYKQKDVLNALTSGT